MLTVVCTDHAVCTDMLTVVCTDHAVCTDMLTVVCTDYAVCTDMLTVVCTDHAVSRHQGPGPRSCSHRCRRRWVNAGRRCGSTLRTWSSATSASGRVGGWGGLRWAGTAWRTLPTVWPSSLASPPSAHWPPSATLLTSSTAAPALCPGVCVFVACLPQLCCRPL